MSSRFVRFVGIPLAGFLLVLFFIYRGFPYDRLRDTLAGQLGRQLGAEVTIQQIGPHWALAGPGIEARGVRLAWDDGQMLPIDRLALRPAWSPAWLRGRPALATLLESPVGRLDGTFVAEGQGGWTGDVSALDLKRLPLESVWQGVAGEGLLDASVDMRVIGGVADGALDFEARDGSLRLPMVPLPVPFEVLTGSLRFGGDAFLEVDTLALKGPLITANVKGRIGTAPRFSDAPLQLEVDLAVQPNMRTAFQSAGVRLGRDGAAKIRISGTPSRPQVR